MVGVKRILAGAALLLGVSQVAATATPGTPVYTGVKSFPTEAVSYTHLTLPTKREV